MTALQGGAARTEVKSHCSSLRNRLISCWVGGWVFGGRTERNNIAIFGRPVGGPCLLQVTHPPLPNTEKAILMRYGLALSPHVVIIFFITGFLQFLFEASIVRTFFIPELIQFCCRDVDKFPLSQPNQLQLVLHTLLLVGLAQVQRHLCLDKEGWVSRWKIWAHLCRVLVRASRHTSQGYLTILFY